MSTLRDRNGLTEEEFLAQYDASKFERPSVTVDLVLFYRGKVLLIRRAGHPSIGKLALPGGFVDPNETVLQAAKRELEEETHIRATALKQLQVFSEPNRDPRTRIITVPFLAHLLDESQEVCAGDDAADAAFWDMEVEEEETLLTFTLAHEQERVTFSVTKTLPDAQGFPCDVQYTVQGDSMLAGDHGAILACAWEEEQRCRRRI